MRRWVTILGLSLGAVIVLFAGCSFLLRLLPRSNEWPTLQKNLADLKLRHATREEAIQVFGRHHDISPGTPGGAGLEEYLRLELRSNPRNSDLLDVREKWIKWTNGISQSTEYSRAWIFFDQSNRVADFVLLGN